MNGLFRISLIYSLLLLSGCLGKEDIKGAKSASEFESSSLIDYWNTQHKGTNQFNKFPSVYWFEAASKANIKLVRLTYGKWESGHRDFLLGDADHYRGLVEEDFLKLKESLDVADSFGIKIVLTPLSLPGARWVQNNEDVQDGRIWKEEKYLEQAKRFWKDLALRLNHHPAIVGFSLKNEPHPEIFYGYEDIHSKGFSDWYDTIKGTVADINYYNRELSAAIREVDKSTPVIIESGLWANAQTFSYLEPLDDPYVIYSFHMYEPYAFTTFRINQNKYSYPGTMPLSPWSDSIITLDEEWLESYLAPVKKWSEKYGIPANRIFAGEFGCSRKTGGVENYLSQLISIFNKNQWHWAFYSFREDVWESMDYELGPGKAGGKYWDFSGKASFHENYDLIYRPNKGNKIWAVFEHEFEGDALKKVAKQSEKKEVKRRKGFPETYHESRSGKLEYGVFVPTETEVGKEYPLLIFLHGWGQNQALYLDWYKKDIQEKHPCFVFTPRTPVEWADWSGWGTELSEPMKVAMQVLDSLLEIYPVDTCRLYVYGISMGGEGTFDLLDKFSGKFAAAMSVCGGGKPEWAENISTTPFWMFHGNKDDINPVTLTRDVYEAMLGIGAEKMKYTEYDGYGHDIWTRVLREPNWYDWMFDFTSCN